METKKTNMENSNNRYKFRAWDKEEKEMFLPETENNSDSFFTGIEDGKLLCQDLEDENPNERYVLMQYTGLKDRKGVEVFKGDIVKVHKFTQELGENMGVCEGEKEFIAKIEFSMYGGIYLEAGENNSGALWEYENGFHEESIEVIGNIYENQELLTN